MMRTIFAAAAVLAIAGAAHADPFAAAYGNTVTQVWPDGNEVIVYVNADHTWEQHTAHGVVKGTYAWKDDTHACFTVTEPVPQNASQATSCNAFRDEHHAVGDTWTETLKDGRTLTISITKGRR